MRPRLGLAGRAAAATVAVALLAAACGGGGKTAKSFDGAQLVVDPKGDTAQIKNADGVTPKKPLGSADITGVRLDGDGKNLTIRIAIGASPMIDLPLDQMQGPSWFAQLFASKTAKEPAYFVAIVRDGDAKLAGGQITGWRLSVCPGTTVCDTPAEGATLKIVAGEVRAQIPLTLLDKLGSPFSWTVLSYWNETQDPVQAFSDWVPESARPGPGSTSFSDPEARAVFPPEK